MESQRIYSNLTVGRTARFDEKLARLLRCAATAFAAQGYERTSIRQVARLAGMSLAGLYYYVTRKEELLFLIQFHTFKMLVENLERILSEDMEPYWHLKRMVSAHVCYLVEHLSELKVCTTELETLSGDYYNRVLRWRQRYFDLTRGIVRRLDGRTDANLATLYLFGMLNWIVMWFDPKRNDPKELSDSLVSIFLHGYLSGSVCRGGMEE